METNQKAGSNSFVAKDGTQLDPTAATLTRAFRDVESQGNYNAKGASGEHGAYQFMPGVFEERAKSAGLDPKDFSPENQDKVQYHWVKSNLDKGLTQSQIAALQNSGSTNYEGKVGTNKFGVKYDVPAYVKKVQDSYIKNTNGPVAHSSSGSNLIDIPTAEASSGTDTQAPQKSFGEKALDFAFPILEKKERTPLQTAADVGLSALTLIPGLGEFGLLAKGAKAAGGLIKGAEVAADVAKGAKAASVGSEISKGVDVAKTATKGPVASPTFKEGLLKAVGKGAALGYASDVGTKLSEGNTNASEILTPGAGSVTGGLLGGGGAALAASGKSVAGRLVNSLIKPLKKDFSYGKNPGRAVAEEGIVGNSLDDLASNIGARKDEIGTEIGKIGDAVSAAKIELSLSPSLSHLDDAMEKAAQTNNQAVFNRLQQTKKALTENLGRHVDEEGNVVIGSKGARKLNGVTYNDAHTLKKLIGDMTQWTGNPSDDKTVNAALQNVWRSIAKTQKDATEKLNPELRTQLEKLNERYGDLTSAEIATKYREAIHGRQNMISLGDKLSGGAGLVTGLMTGGPVTGGMGALTGAALSHLAGTSAAKTRVAKYLAKAGDAKSAIASKNGKTSSLIPGLLKTAAVRAASGQ